MIATRVMADPFKKVKKMIKDLIVKLMEEANEEAETKGFCDTELSTNEHTRKEKTSQVEMLTADIDELTASVTVLTEEIGELSTQLSELAAAVEKATSIRSAEKKKNKETISDAQDAQAAVEKALGVLKAFYDKAGKATALDQQPEIFDDTPYKGMGAERCGGGGCEGVRLFYEGFHDGQGHEDQGRGAQDREEDEPRAVFAGEEERPRRYPEGAGRRHEVLRQVEAHLRLGWLRELRGPRGPAQGGDRVTPGGPSHLERRGHRFPSGVSQAGPSLRRASAAAAKRGGTPAGESDASEVS